MQKYIVIITTIFLLGCNGQNKFSDHLSNEISISFDADYLQADTPYANTVACNLNLSGTVTSVPTEEKFKARLSQEEHPLVVSITDINTEKPILIAGSGFRANLIRSLDNDEKEKIYMFEITDAGNLNVWTLFRKLNIITLTKQYNLLDGVISYSMIGSCKNDFE